MKKHILSLFLSTILIIAAITVSAEVTTDDASSVVTLTGVVPSKQSGVNIGIDVFCPGMGYEDLRQTPVIEFKRVLVMRNQVVSGENGEWSFTFKIIDDPALDYDAKSGTYTAVIFSEDAANAYQETFVYVN